jgi:hypothetical protein
MEMFKYSRIRFTELYQDSVKYLQATYEQASQLFTNASPFGQLLNVILNLGKMIMYYIEDSITELNINTATRSNSIYGLARLAGHNPMRGMAANGNIKISYNGENVDMYGNTVIIPNFTKILCQENSLPYIMIMPNDELRVTLTPRSFAIAKIYQGEIEAQKSTGTGRKLQSFSFTQKRGRYIDNYNVKVYVNGTQWSIYDSILDIPYQSNGCVVKTGLTNGIDLFFGNGYKGNIPGLGAEIRIEYLTSAGYEGNIRMTDNTTWKFTDVGYDILGNEVQISDIFDIKTESNISFGVNPEPLYMTKLLTPMVSRNFVLANPTNYIYFLEKLNYFSYIDAFTTFDDNDITDDNVIYLFLVPDINKRIKSNENYFTVPQENFKLKDDEKNNIYSLIEESGQKIVTTVVSVLDPKFKRYIINIVLVTFEGFNKDSIRQEIETKMSEYFLKNRRRDKIPKSDLIAIVENIQGVDSVNLWFTGEDNEDLKKNDPTAQDIGLDEFGDIILKRDELVLIRGGWSDRNDVYINDNLDPNKASCININFAKVTPKTYNSNVHDSVMKKIKK